MNLVDAVVVAVSPEVEFHDYGEIQYWSVDVVYDSWGRESNTSLTFATKEEAEAVKVGYEFVC